MSLGSPGALPGYETTFISRTDLTDDALKQLRDRLQKVVQNFKGEVVNSEDWGKRKLAYPIGRETRGHYTYFVYSGAPGVVAEVERNLKLNESILRFLTVNLGSEFDKEKYLEQLEQAKRREESPAERGSYGARDRDFREAAAPVRENRETTGDDDVR